MRKILCAATILLASCGGEGGPCGGITGSCLSMRLEGQGQADKIAVVAFQKDAGPFSMNVGNLLGGPCDLPCLFRVRPPPNVLASTIVNLGVSAQHDQKPFSQTLPISWPDGAHIEKTVTLP